MTLTAPLFRAIAFGLFGAGCAASNVSIVYAPGFTPNPQAISVLGVFKDGRMNQDAWKAFGASLPLAFRADRCTAGLASLSLDDPELFTQVDATTMEEGVTDEMIDHLSPAANAKTILLISTWGTAATERKVTDPPSPPTSRRGRSRQAGNPGPRTVGNPGFAKLMASVYSVSAHARTAALTVKYTGEDPSEAIKTFEQELAKLLGNASCADWTWKAVTAESPSAL